MVASAGVCGGSGRVLRTGRMLTLHPSLGRAGETLRARSIAEDRHRSGRGYRLYLYNGNCIVFFMEARHDGTNWTSAGI